MAFEAYSVAIRLTLINGVSQGLGLISGHLRTTGHDVDALHSKLKEIKMLGLGGAAIGGAGFLGLGLIGKTIKPASEYAHQLNIMNMAGMKQKEIAEATGVAWKNTGTILTSTATGNLRALLDMKNVLGDFAEAKMMLPFVTKMQAVLAASKEGKLSENSKDFAYSMAKALDIIGAVRSPERFKVESEMMAKVITATQGRVTPDAYKSVFQYARQAKLPMSDVFKYEILPTLIQENAGSGGGGGGSRGVGPMMAAMYRWTNQGFINKKSLPELISMGLAGPGTHLKTTTSGTTIGPMKNADLAGANPFDWVNTVMVPAIYKKYGNISDQEVVKHINMLTRGNQLAGSVMTEFFYKQKNFLRDQSIIRGAMPVDQAYKAALSNDPNTAMDALKSQWENFKVSFMMGVVPVVIPALIKLSEGFNKLALWGREHPQLMQKIALGFIGLSGAMAFSGTVMMLTAGFKALGIGLTVLRGAAVLAAGGQGAVGIPTLISLLGKTGLVAAAGAAGFAIGTLINKLLGIDKGELGSWLYDKLHDSQGRNVFSPFRLLDNMNPQNRDAFMRGLGGGPPVTSNPVSHHGAKAVQVHSQIHLDGRQIATVVSKHQANAADGPQRGISSFDMNMAFAPVGY